MCCCSWAIAPTLKSPVPSNLIHLSQEGDLPRPALKPSAMHPSALQMLLETLRWRAEYRPEALDWEAIKHEGARGKLFILDHADNDDRPVVIMRPR